MKGGRGGGVLQSRVGRRSKEVWNQARDKIGVYLRGNQRTLSDLRQHVSRGVNADKEGHRDWTAAQAPFLGLKVG